MSQMFFFFLRGSTDLNSMLISLTMGGAMWSNVEHDVQESAKRRMLVLVWLLLASWRRLAVRVCWTVRLFPKLWWKYVDV